jgi:hypothetical protein
MYRAGFSNELNDCRLMVALIATTALKSGASPGDDMSDVLETSSKPSCI